MTSGRRPTAGDSSPPRDTATDAGYEPTVQEREVKLSLAGGAAALDPEKLFAGLGRWTDDTVDRRATYYDTSDLRLTQRRRQPAVPLR